MTNLTPVEEMKVYAKKNNAVELTYNPEWANGTGYFNKLVDEILPTPVAYTVDDNARYVLCIELSPGDNIILFQRYTGDLEKVTSNWSNLISRFVGAICSAPYGKHIEMFLNEAFIDGLKAIARNNFDVVKMRKDRFNASLKDK